MATLWGRKEEGERSWILPLLDFFQFQALNLLYFKVSWDYEFLKQSHQQVIKSDEFTRRLMSILDIVYKEGIKQPITLLTQRADYMCHYDGIITENEINFDKFQLKQVLIF